MSYNTITTAKERTGETITTTLLNDAKSIIDSYTTYRWEETSKTESLSGDSTIWLQLRSPIIAVSSFTIDAISQTEDTDFEIRKIPGVLKCYNGLAYGHDNIAITYTYGWTSDDDFYTDTFNLICRIEAAIALYFKMNPGIINSFSIEGMNMNYEGSTTISHINKLLRYIPRPDFFGSIGDML